MKNILIKKFVNKDNEKPSNKIVDAIMMTFIWILFILCIIFIFWAAENIAPEIGRLIK